MLLVCTQLYELEVQLGSEHYKTIEHTGTLMHLDANDWTYLEVLDDIEVIGSSPS